MKTSLTHLRNAAAWRRAGPDDLVCLWPAPGQNELYIPKIQLEVLGVGLHLAKYAIHISGPTGSGKTALIDALQVEKNYQQLCRRLEQPVKRLRVWEVEMCLFESPAELIQRRAIRTVDGAFESFDDPSLLVKALLAASHYGQDPEIQPCILLKEIGRAHSSMVQNGLLNLMNRSTVTLTDGTTFSTRGIAWIADSNYAVDETYTHALTLFDQAFKRRFTINLTSQYLTPEQELAVLSANLKQEN